MVFFASLLLYMGMVSAEPARSQNAATQSPQVSQINDEQTQIEQAADHFDAFARQIPLVVAAKLNAFRKRGFRAIFLDDPETQPAEEAMIDSLVKGLQALGNALLEDLAPSTPIKEDLPVIRKQANQ
jgi:hypothetical protein